MQYRYKLHNFNDNQDFLSAVKKIKDVTDVLVEDGDLLVTVNDRAYEFDFLNSLFSISTDFDVTLDMGEDEETPDNGPIDQDLGENEDKTPTKKAKDKASAVFDDNDYDDALEKSKKELKREVISRCIELSVSLALLIVSLFIQASGQTFSARTILTIIAFSIAGYEAVYQTFIEISKKRFFDGNLITLLVCVSFILLGYQEVATAIIILFAVAQSVVTFTSKKRKLLIDEAFYTGSLPVLRDGVYVAPSTLKKGEVITLNPGDVVPCDGIILCDGELSSYQVDFSDKIKYCKGETVLAGSVVLGEKITVELGKNFGESLIDNKRKEFEEATTPTASPKYKKVAKIALYGDICLIIVSLLITFLLPIKESSYVNGLYTWGFKGTMLLSLGLLTFAVKVVTMARQNIYAIAILKGVRLGDTSNVLKIAKANALKIDAGVILNKDLTAIKNDSLPTLNELHQAGIENIVVDFDNANAPEQIKKQLDFVQKPLKQENQICIGNGTGDISVNGGDTNILNGQIGFAPVAYRLCKNSVKTQKAITVLLIASKLACMVGAMFITFKVLPVAIWVLLQAFIVAISAITTYTSVSKIK